MKYYNTLAFILLLNSYPVLAQDKGNASVIDGPTTLLKNYDSSSVLKGLDNVNDVLYEVLSLTYLNNTTIRAARAETLSIQEQLTQAKSGYLPKVEAVADVTYTDTKAEGNSFIVSNGGNTSKSAGLNLNQPLYRGGSTQANITQSQNIIAAQEFNLSGIEQMTLYDAVVAYMDLYRDQAVLELRNNNKRLVEKELDQAKARFKVGEITRTDVSQSEARLADAKAGVINAQAAVKTSMAVFQQVVGSPPPIDMGYPVIKFDIPTILDEALSLAESNNRDILQARFIKQAANARIDSVKGELLPQINAIGRLDKSYTPSDFIDEQRQAAVGVTASIPLYTGGATQSRIREAKKIELQRAEQVNAVREQVKKEVISHWEDWEAAKAETVARVSQVEASTVAREGVHYETEFGERTTLDSLNANQELLTAQVELIKSKRNEIVARFGLARSLGLLVPQNLGFSTAKL